MVREVDIFIGNIKQDSIWYAFNLTENKRNWATSNHSLSSFLSESYSAYLIQQNYHSTKW